MIINSKNNLLTNYNTAMPNYREPAALQELLHALYFEGTEQDEMHGQFTISIGNHSIAFYYGGPQIEALMTFCEQLAAENAMVITHDSADAYVDADDCWFNGTDYLK